MSRHDNRYRGGRDQRYVGQQDQFSPRSQGGGNQQGGFGNSQRGFGGGQQGDWHGGGTRRFSQAGGYSADEDLHSRSSRDAYRDDSREIGGAYGLRDPRDRGPSEQDYGGAQDNFGGSQSAAYNRGSSSDRYTSPNDWQQRGYGGSREGRGGWGGPYGDYRLEGDNGPQNWQDWQDRQGRSHDQNRHEFEPDYHQWRAEQVRALDDDYRNWRQDRYKKFSEEFSDWRKNRSTASSDNTSNTLGTDSAQTSSKNK